MTGLRRFLLSTASMHATERALDDVAAFWTAVEWNAYLRRDNMLSVCVGWEPMEMPAGATKALGLPYDMATRRDHLRAVNVEEIPVFPIHLEQPRYIHRVYATGYYELPNGTQLPLEARKQVEEIFDRHARRSMQEIAETPSCSVLDP